MKRKQVPGVNIGSSTMLLIFVIISLVSFSVLSLSSAITDKKFTENIRQKNIAYYNACNLAEEQLGELDVRLARAYATSDSMNAYFDTVTKGTTITVPISDYQNLQVEVEFLYPQEEGDSYYRITSYSLVNISTPELDESLILIH